MLEIGEWSNREVGGWLIEDKNAPNFIEGAPRLRRYLELLHELMKSDFPPNRLVKSSEIVVVKYGFGDASYTGFGSS